MNHATPLHKRYPGVKPFETSERNLFFGRDRDIEDLTDLVWLEKMVVLFGKSGYGKSSLINAGLLPELEKEARPVLIRLGSYMPPVQRGDALMRQTPPPVEVIKNKLEETLPHSADFGFLDRLDFPKNLWYHVKRKQTRDNRRFIFIFDQFEEFFTYPLSEQQAFKEQLAELLYTEVPQALRNLNDSLSEAQQTLIATPFDAKVLFSIRADRMSLLDSMKDKLPNIFLKRYELKGLTEDQARQAIEKPARSAGSFASPAFEYSSDALRVMTRKLSETKSAQRSGIEAFQLQILCEYLEDKVIKGEIPDKRIVPEHFEHNINDIYEGYYQRLIDKIDKDKQHAAQLLIEEQLLFEDAKTGEARRLSVDSGVLLNLPGVDQALLDRLESTFLLRRESTSTGGFNYEISHDTMIAPILQSRSERRALETAEQERLENRRKQQRLMYVLAALITVLAIVIGVVIYVLQLRNKAEQAAREAIAAKEEAYRERDNARKSLEDKEIADFADVLRRAKSILDRGTNCPDSLMIQNIDSMKVKYPNNQKLQEDIRAIDAQLQRCR